MDWEAKKEKGGNAKRGQYSNRRMCYLTAAGSCATASRAYPAEVARTAAAQKVRWES